MPETYQRYCGLDFEKGLHPIFLDLILAKHWREPPYNTGSLKDPGEHLLRAARALFTHEEFGISSWTEEHAHDFTTESFQIVFGCAASGKSNDYGCFTVLDWITDPTQTISILASTTSDMLQLRTFESATRYFRLLKRSPKFLIPGKESKQRLAIINVEEDEGPTVTIKASIKGVAVQQGSVDEARANLQGAHLPYVRLILDELSQMREAAMKARTNLSTGARDFKLVGLCNPDNLGDLACRFAVPVGGWSAIDRETDTYWRTRWGIVRRHDGLKSPAIAEPAKFPYLIQQSDIDRAVTEAGNNLDDASVWTMVRGFPPPQGGEQTVLTEAMLNSFHARDPVVWAAAGSDPILGAGLDPAFTSGGDAAIFQPFKVGYEAVSNLLVVAFEPELIIPIKSTSSRPAIYQVADWVVEWAEDHDLNLANLGVDETGTQRAGDVIEMEYVRKTGKQVTLCRVNGASSASEFPVSVRRNVPARKEYGNVTTELYYAMNEFVAHSQIRGLPAATGEEFCSRRVLLKRPRVLEIKIDAKKRLRHSPDRADAAAVGLAVVKWVLGVVPGATLMKPDGGVTSQTVGIPLSLVRQFDVDTPESTYQKSFI